MAKQKLYEHLIRFRFRTFLLQSITRFNLWRVKNMDPRTFISLFSILIGIGSGLAAVTIKNSVSFIHHLTITMIPEFVHQYMRFLLPVLGVAFALLIIKYIVRHPISHGIPNVLYSISKRNGKISKHNTYSSVLTSAFTVGFGGSIGLEGPTVATGAAIGSNLSILFRLEYKQIMLMLGCACAGAMAAIFKAPIAAIVFAVEVIMIDLTSFSLIPLLLSSASAVLTSYFFLGQEVVYPFDVKIGFQLHETPWYIALGIVTGIISAYFSLVYRGIGERFEKIKNTIPKWIIGGTLLGLTVFLLPPLFGEGYNEINNCLGGNLDYLYKDSFFSYLEPSEIWTILILLLLILFKIFAASFTFGAGGVGGIFAPTLFMGVHTGMLFAMVLNLTGLTLINENNYALLGMGGMIAGVLHAPLTGLFLIADLSGGYKMFVPLMLVTSFSYLTVKFFYKNSVYTYQLARRRELFTHDKDKAVLSMLRVNRLIETDFITVSNEATLGDLVKAIENSSRNLFPIVDKEGILHGMLKLDDVRRLIFRPEKYETIKVQELMYYPEFTCAPSDSMHDVVEKFHQSGRYNLAVIENGKYIGFISKARVFSAYQKTLKHFSHD